MDRNLEFVACVPDDFQELVDRLNEARAEVDRVVNTPTISKIVQEAELKAKHKRLKEDALINRRVEEIEEGIEQRRLEKEREDTRRKCLELEHMQEELKRKIESSAALERNIQELRGFFQRSRLNVDQPEEVQNQVKEAEDQEFN